MTYYPADEAAADRDLINLSWLPSEILRLFPSREVIARALRRGGDPATLSLMKWRRVRQVFDYISDRPVPAKYYHEIKRRIDWETCALCVACIERYKQLHGHMEYGNDRCKICVLGQIDCCTKEKSVFRQIESALFVMGSVYGIPDEMLISKHYLLGHLIDCMIINLELATQRPPLPEFLGTAPN